MVTLFNLIILLLLLLLLLLSPYRPHLARDLLRSRNGLHGLELSEHLKQGEHGNMTYRWMCQEES